MILDNTIQNVYMGNRLLTKSFISDLIPQKYQIEVNGI